MTQKSNYKQYHVCRVGDTKTLYISGSEYRYRISSHTHPFFSNDCFKRYLWYKKTQEWMNQNSIWILGFLSHQRDKTFVYKKIATPKHMQEKDHFGLLFVKYMFPVASNNKASIKCLHQSLTLYRQKSFSENYSSIIHRSRIGNQWVSLFLQDEGLRSFKNVPTFCCYVAILLSPTLRR